jgi:hypothetical protein
VAWGAWDAQHDVRLDRVLVTLCAAAGLCGETPKLVVDELSRCHVAAQLNQLRRALEHKMETGQEDDVRKMVKQAAVAGAVGAGAIAAGPMVQRTLSHANLGLVSKIAAADAEPFTVLLAPMIHFWHP